MDSIRIATLVDNLKQLTPDSLATVREDIRKQLPDSLRISIFGGLRDSLSVARDSLALAKDKLGLDSLAKDTTLTERQLRRLERRGRLRGLRNAGPGCGVRQARCRKGRDGSAVARRGELRPV